MKTFDLNKKSFEREEVEEIILSALSYGCGRGAAMGDLELLYKCLPHEFINQMHQVKQDFYSNFASRTLS